MGKLRRKTRSNLSGRAEQNAGNIYYNNLYAKIQERSGEEALQKAKEQGYLEGFEAGKKKGHAAGYDEGFSKGWQQQEDFGEITTESTFLLALTELYGFSKKRLLDVIEHQNELIGKYNSDDIELIQMISILKGKGVEFKETTVNTAIVMDRMIRQGKVKPYFPKGKKTYKLKRVP